MKKQTLMMLMLAAVISMGAIGCDNRTDAERAADNLKSGANELGNDTKRALNSADRGIEKAVDNVADKLD